MTGSSHTHSASYREVLIEHLFVGEIMRCLWLRGVSRFEVLRPQVDDSGYDLLFEANSIMRHVQLKSSMTSATTAEVHASMNLLTKPRACVIWIHFDPATMALGPYFWFGGQPGERMPDIAGFKTARHVRANSEGKKAERPNHRVLPRFRFERIDGIGALIARLFGEFPATRNDTGLYFLPNPSSDSPPMTSSAVHRFDRDEAGFYAWLAEHPTGLVVNTLRSVPANYRVLHRSTCWTIRPGRKGASPGAFTERAYIKICGLNTVALIASIGPLSSRCSICGST